MPDVSPAQAQGSQDALYHGQGQGRRPVDARNVHGVRGTAAGRERRWRTLRLCSGQAFSTGPFIS
ncbi:MAG: hypothetical protein VST68_03510 [Nitrospirota bacterium]|nr:hypothetical protein [Nitrospirota bacterium]